MKRHKSLHPLSQHHHFALIQAVSIRRAAGLPTIRREAALGDLARKFLRFWKQTGQRHFREEEEVLLPAYARHVPLDQDPEVMRMLAEHAAIRARVGQVAALLKRKQPVEAVFVELGRLLNDHVRLEENRIFPRIEKTLDEAELEALAAQLTRLHAKGSCAI